MRTPAILLRSTTTADDLAPSSSPGATSIDSDTVVILASLLCALICVAGLALVARCACRRARRPATPTTATSSSSSHLPPPPPPKGLKKKAIDALPTVSFAAAASTQRQGECAVCLVEFAAGEELRVLPHCGHGFHVACIDTWLGAHATCPSCRATIGSSSPPPHPGRCRRCGATCDDIVDVTSAAAAGVVESFLP